MNIYVKSEICRTCSYFKKYDSLIEAKDPYHTLRTLYGEYDSYDSNANTFVGKCMKCNNNISLEYLKNKKSCPFVKLTDDEVRLLRIWSVVWNSQS